ncbi:MAG: hypothetical protein KatS3mg022_2362 [Armatimonadota bacterium]|nr:MAG: hypothetical protein KatS3mg022_2362 [Armatimonadota bacterium]
MMVNLLFLVGLTYWFWRYATNHYLCFAAVSDDFSTAELVLRLGASPNYRLPTGETPLTLARHPLMIKTLLAAGADVNARDGIGRSALFLAVERGDMSVVKVLVEHGADVNQATDSGVTPLMIASRDGRLDIVQLLVDHGADPTLRDRRGFTAIDFARGRDRAEHRVIKQLLQKVVVIRRSVP